VLRSTVRLIARRSEAAQRIQLEELADELELHLRGELDFVEEAHNTELVRRLVERFDALVVPRVIQPYVTERALVLELIPGRRVEAGHGLERERVALLAREFFRAYVFQVVVEGVYHADPHHGNVLLTEDGRLALLARRSGATFGFPPRLRSWARRSHRADSIARILDPELDPVSLIEQESLEVMTREVEHRLEPNRSLSCVDDPPLRPCLRVTRLGARHRDASRPAMSWASDRSDLPFGVAPSSL